MSTLKTFNIDNSNQRRAWLKKVSLNILRQPYIISLITILKLLLIWFLVTEYGLIQPLYLPSPQAVIVKFVTLLSEGYMDATLWQHASASFARIGLALLFAVLLGIPTGLLIGINKVAYSALDPLIEFYRPVPPLAYLPLIVIWFGIGELSKVLLIFLAVFAPLVVATVSGVKSVDPIRIRAAQSLGANRLQIVRFIVLPSALPDILTGVRIGLGAGWSTLVAAELIAATQGLGFMIQSASQFLVTDLVVVGILIIAGIAYSLELGLRWLQQKLTPWQGKTR
jgi:taurine transport system permease protein